MQLVVIPGQAWYTVACYPAYTMHAMERDVLGVFHNRGAWLPSARDKSRKQEIESGQSVSVWISQQLSG